MTEKIDHRIICDMVSNRANVLDLGCGDGELMSLLIHRRNAQVQGIELDDEAVQSCVEKGLTVFQGDIEAGLADYPDGSFDDVILNQSMQQVKNVGFVIDESLRVGRRVIIGFPNFAHLWSRSSLFFRGRTPVTPELPYTWDETPNVRFLSIKDFKAFCVNRGYSILDAVFLDASGIISCCPNLFARKAIYVLSQHKGS